MTRVSLIDESQMTSEQRAQYERFPSNLSRGLLLMESRLAGALPAVANALRSSSLDPKMREAVILRVAALHDSAYERMQHLDQARKVGWSDDDIAAIETCSTHVGALQLREVLAFVDACVSGPAIADEVFDGVRRILSERQIATLIVLIGHYMTVARFIGILQIDLDPKPDPWVNEH